ncbi:PadR family transcriptional regulator [Fodinicola feengrottensis]|uniref:PadR family transcriptional regulator n=1 Tax=Fodinicola feengrottensis TaxID=435914 RepID=UPI002443657D|nr:PadR family transcriptional regulator [Fodinicola feengrottensis]
MSLRHALLALLEAEPMSGYSLAKFFDQSVAYVWHAPHSQIYPELRRMSRPG